MAHITPFRPLFRAVRISNELIMTMAQMRVFLTYELNILSCYFTVDAAHVPRDQNH